MQYLSKEDMLNVNGGGLSITAMLGIIGGAIVFLIGFVDGIIYPKKCK